ncbi:MAG: hypothetical protein M3014_11460 [Chloroflexota bacterium]|nr:hypothetical protein [Chloroflexota bacterium]
MAENKKVEELRRKSRLAAMEGLRPRGGFPVPPRKAVSRANKYSKKLAYPVPPYPGASLPQLYRWAHHEYWQLGRWRNLALPFAILSALLTWEREHEMKEARWSEIENNFNRRKAAEIYVSTGRPKARKRKLLGLIPLPGGKKS